jgi:hypothetical protein
LGFAFDCAIAAKVTFVSSFSSWDKAHKALEVEQLSIKH